MTVAELRTLRTHDRVLWDYPAGDHRAPLRGRVVAADGRFVEIRLSDEASAVIWFRHAESGLDGRHRAMWGQPVPAVGQED